MDELHEKIALSSVTICHDGIDKEEDHKPTNLVSSEHEVHIKVGSPE